jgi:hypothetical protein
MITLSYAADRYCIHHAARPGAHSCFINKSFLPDNAQKILDSLLIFGKTQDHVYILTERQNREVSHILDKIQLENRSNYMFSEQLEKTYMLELVHFLTKLHFQAHPYARTRRRVN